MKQSFFLSFLAALIWLTNPAGAEELSEECTQYLKTRGVEKATLEVVAPVIVRAVDQFLRSPGLDRNSKLIFMARDGKAGYQVAKVLLALHPERYPNVKREQISFLHVNRAVLWSSFDLIPDYLKQHGVTPEKTVSFFDVGWIGSMSRQLKVLTEQTGARFGGLYLIYSLGDESSDVAAYLKLDWQAPFSPIVKNPVLHFLRDTYSGPHLQIYELHREGDLVEPVLRGDYIWKEREVREAAIKAVISSAENLKSEDLDDSEEAQGVTDRLIQFMSERDNFIKLMVPQDKH